MKKALSLILVLALFAGLCGCGEPVKSLSERATDGGDVSNPRATIINNAGETESLTAREIINIADGNGAAFDIKYFGAKVTVIGKVEHVEGYSSYNGHTMNAYIELEGGWIVEAASKSEVADLMPGDTVKVTGHIATAFVDVCLYRINGWGTTIKPYNG